MVVKWMPVFHFPKPLVTRDEPPSIAYMRKNVTNVSRRVTSPIQMKAVSVKAPKSSRRRIAQNADRTSSLSASGSIKSPNGVTCWCNLASLPSKRSLNAPNTKSAVATIRMDGDPE